MKKLGKFIDLFHDFIAKVTLGIYRGIYADKLISSGPYIRGRAVPRLLDKKERRKFNAHSIFFARALIVIR